MNLLVPSAPRMPDDNGVVELTLHTLFDSVQRGNITQDCAVDAILRLLGTAYQAIAKIEQSLGIHR